LILCILNGYPASQGIGRSHLCCVFGLGWPIHDQLGNLLPSEFDYVPVPDRVVIIRQLIVRPFEPKFLLDHSKMILYSELVSRSPVAPDTSVLCRIRSSHRTAVSAEEISEEEDCNRAKKSCITSRRYGTPPINSAAYSMTPRWD